MESPESQVGLNPLKSWNVGQPIRTMDFFRHEKGVLLAVADAGGNVALFEPATGAPFAAEDGKPVRVTAPHGAPVYALSHLRRPTGWPALATVGGDGTTRVYDIATGDRYVEKALLAKEELRVIDTFQDPDGSATIAVAGKGDNVYLWRADANSPVVLTGHTGPIRALQALRTERLLAVADERGITVWCIDGPKPVRKSFVPGRCRSLAVLRELGQVRLASATSAGLRLWDPETGEALAHFAHQLNASAVVAFEAEDDEQLLAVASDRTVSLWSPATESRARTQLSQVPGGATQVLAKILTGNGTLLAAADDRGSVAVWRLTPQRRAANLVGKHDDWINDLVVVGSSRRLVMASASDDRTVRLWNLDSRPARHREHRHETQVQALALAGDGLFASGDQDGELCLWSAQDRAEPKWVRRTDHGAIRAMTSFRTRDGWWLVSAGGGGHCTLWDVDGRADPVELRRPSHNRTKHSSPPVRAVAAAEVNGRWYVAAGDFGGRVEVWDAATGAVYWTLDQAHPTQVRSLAALHVSGRTLLASGGSAGGIRLWDLAAKRLVGESSDGHSGPVAALCTVRDSQTDLLASGGADRSIRLWDPEAIARPISEISNAHDSWVRALVQVSNGESTHLASGGEEGAIKLWQIRDRRLVRITHWLSIRGFRDRLAKTDVLDRRAIVDELSALLSPDADPVASGTSGPQVVMIQGAWGTGKSSVMHDLRERLEGRSAAEPQRQHTRELTPRQTSRLIKRGTPTPQHPPQPVQRTVTAWFNPWAHESSEQVWSGLAWTIIDATRNCLGAAVAERQAYWLNRNIQRLDRAALRRTIRQRIWRPTLTALAGLLLPLGVSLVRIGTFDAHNVVDWLPIGLAALTTLVVLVLGAYGLCQHLFGRVTAYLPADIFDGPVDQASFVTGTGERLLRDPPYVNAAGQLYRINDDIYQLTKDLGDRGYQLVVFIDDLDRCSRRSTADVFEAINSFLSDRHFPETAPRFVIGLDATVVAGRLSETNTPEHSHLDPDDPGPGWSILRKLSQLTVVLPGIRSAHTTRLLRHHAPRPSTSRAQAPTTTENATAPQRPLATRLDQASGSATVATPAGANRSDSDPYAGNGADTTPELLPLEGEPTVHEHLRRLIRLRPRQTMRETKRLLTLWAFYMRLLDRVMPPGTTANVQDACDALTLAEIVRRWPALVPALARTDDGPSGLSTLIAAIARDDAEDNRWTRNWHTTLKGIDLTQPYLARATENLHRLLREHGNERVASFADRLL